MVDAVEDCLSHVIDEAKMFKVCFASALASKGRSQSSEVPVTV